MSTRAKERRSMALLMACTLMWSISGLMIKQIPWNAAVIAGFRSLLAGVVMALYIRFSGLPFLFTRRTVLSGILMSSMFLTFILANKLTTAANAIVIQSSAPVFVLLYNTVARRQRVRKFELLTVVLTMIGISIFFVNRLESGRLLGNAIALLSGVLLAATYIVNCGAPPALCMNGILVAHIVTVLIGIPLAFVLDTPVTGGTMWRVVVLGIVQLGIPYVLYGLAMQDCPPLAASLIGILEAIYNPLWVFLFTGEAPSGLEILGGLLVLSAIVMWTVCTERLARRAEGYK